MCTKLTIRIWIAQEVTLAKNVLVKVGQHEANIKVLESKTTKALVSSDRTLFEVLCSLRKNVRGLGKPPLWQLLLDMRDCQSSRVNDRVYGVLGLCNEDHCADGALPDRLDVKVSKSEVDLFWDVMLESCVPWSKISKFFRELATALGVWELVQSDEHSLLRYAVSQNTSDRHKRLANIALEISASMRSVLKPASETWSGTEEAEGIEWETRWALKQGQKFFGTSYFDFTKNAAIIGFLWAELSLACRPISAMTDTYSQPTTTWQYFTNQDQALRSLTSTDAVSTEGPLILSFDVPRAVIRELTTTKPPQLMLLNHTSTSLRVLLRLHDDTGAHLRYCKLELDGFPWPFTLRFAQTDVNERPGLLRTHHLKQQPL